MAIEIRTEGQIHQALLNMIVAQGTVGLTDIGPKSILSQITQAQALEIASLYGAVWESTKLLNVSDCTGEDLDNRVADLGIERPSSVAAYGDLTISLDSASVTVDLVIAQGQQFYMLDVDGLQIYHEATETVDIMAQGRSVSGEEPATSVLGGVNDRIKVNIDNDGAQEITLGNQVTGGLIAARIQVLVRALTAVDPAKQGGYDAFICDYDTTTTGKYTARSGSAGTESRCVFSDGSVSNGADDLGLGVLHGGVETAGSWSGLVEVQALEAGYQGNAAPGAISHISGAIVGVTSVSNAERISTGSDQWSDQELRAYWKEYIDGLSRGTTAALRLGARTITDKKNNPSPNPRIRSVAVYEFPLIDDASISELVYQVAGQTSNVYIWADNGTPDSDLIDAVQERLDGDDTEEDPGWRGAGCQVLVMAASAAYYTVAVDVIARAGVSTAWIKSQIDASIAQYFAGLGIGDSVSPSAIRGAIWEWADYILDYTLLAPSTTQETLVSATEGQIPVLGRVVIGVISE